MAIAKGLLGFGLVAIAAGQTVEFNRDVRPILSDRCFACHGPDQSNRKSKLRLDVEESARGAIASGELVKRVSSTNAALRMPPVYTGQPALPERDISVLKKWVDEGGRWQAHWAFISPKRPALPDVSDRSWSKNAIDRFVLAKLDREGLKPSPEADRERLIRRVTLDLTGLPPAPAEVDAFVADTSANAYEKVVDRLLASTRYGERMAIRWLDAARYADTNGYQTDAERYMWRWRDWVINAFNSNMPFDQFTIEQLAGDLLPNPTLDQLIATGFNRNHRGNGEGGIIPEEYAMEYVADRVETTSTVWMGVTMGCTRCHDHKYDPFKQRDYYSLFAYFNNIPERGKAFKYGNSPPFVSAPTPDQQRTLAEMDGKVNAAEGQWRSLDGTMQQAFAAWKAGAAREVTAAYQVPRGFQARLTPETKTAADAGNFGFMSAFTISAAIRPTSANGAIVSRTEDFEEAGGWGLFLKDGKLQLNMVVRWLDDSGRVETKKPLAMNEWHHVAVSYDGSRSAENIRMYVDGRPVETTIVLDEINQDFRTKHPLRVGRGYGLNFSGDIGEILLHQEALSEKEVALLAERTSIATLAAKPNRTPLQEEAMRLYFLEHAAPAPVAEAWRTLSTLRESRRKMVDAFPTVMVMQERAEIRPAFILQRGSYEKPGEPVTRETPAAIRVPGSFSKDRLGLAKWLVHEQNPLTARVMVNRFWQMYFGTGLVKTVEDFGSQGEWPSHPDLLDWLATEFVASKWNVKALQKQIVMSATYRQSAKATPALVQKDPENRLLARGPRLRLGPEVVRDQALASSGLLVEKIGGPSVKPYQPAGLWKELSGGADYQRDHGANLYRRSLYTFWKRASPPPGMMTFDSAGRETCIVRENRTNTPLQALTLMNDVTYVEAARNLAQRMLTETSDASARLAYGFRLTLARRPSSKETEVLTRSLNYYRDRFATNKEERDKLLQEGESPVPEKLDRTELAAYTALASLILNLDEVVTKE